MIGPQLVFCVSLAPRCNLISKKVIDGKIEFKDLMGSMMNLGSLNLDEEGDEFDEGDYR